MITAEVVEAGSLSASGGFITATNIEAGDINLTNVRLSSSFLPDVGKDIALRSAKDIKLRTTSIATNGIDANAGNLDLSANNLIDIVASRLQATSTNARGGRIGLSAETVNMDVASIVDASAGPLGVDGTVSIHAPNQSILGVIRPAGPPTELGVGIRASGLNTIVETPIIREDGRGLINIRGGSRPGGGRNIFHSFDDFSVGRIEVANFLNDTGLGTDNIIARVTGQTQSQVLGWIDTTGFGAANFYLINPAGILIGPAARLNVGGSVNVGTPDYLRLSDGTVFSAVSDTLEPLSGTSISGFGYLSPPRAGVTIQGESYSPDLLPSAPTNISLFGGDISIANRRITTGGGSVLMTSLSATGEGSLSSGHFLPEGTQGSIALNADINTSTFEGGGDIVINAGILRGGSMQAGSQGFLDQGGTISLRVGNLDAGGIGGRHLIIHGTSRPGSRANHITIGGHLSADTVSIDAHSVHFTAGGIQGGSGQ
jgi:filamentous hemagglutinin family protein